MRWNRTGLAPLCDRPDPMSQRDMVYEGGRQRARVFDVVGVNYVNKGAQLMLRAIEQRIASAPYPSRMTLNVKAARHAHERGERIPASLWLERSRPGRTDAVFRKIGDALPGWLMRRFNWVADREVDVILDASGFLYSDQWGIKGMSRRKAAAALWRACGKKLIFMPQAFGPFERPESRACMRELIGLADLIYARDPQSRDYLAELAPSVSHIRLAPDFTNLVEPVWRPELERYAGAVALVPNQRMLDRREPEDTPYTAFLVTAARALLASGRRVFLLLHEARDRALAQSVQAQVDAGLEIVFRDDPLELKGLIARCDFIVSSRFHAIVSALSQGVPAIGTSWSHKYRQLYEDYGAADLLIPSLAGSADAFGAVLAALADPARRDRIAGRLSAAAAGQKQRAVAMWDEIFALAREPA